MISHRILHKMAHFMYPWVNHLEFTVIELYMVFFADTDREIIEKL